MSQKSTTKSPPWQGGNTTVVRCLGRGPGRGKRPRIMDVWTIKSVYPPPLNYFSPVPEIYDHQLETSGGGSDCFGWIVWSASLSGGWIDQRNRLGGLSGGRIDVALLFLFPPSSPNTIRVCRSAWAAGIRDLLSSRSFSLPDWTCQDINDWTRQDGYPFR